MNSLTRNLISKIISIIIFTCVLLSNNYIFHAEDTLYTEGDFQYYIVDDAAEIAFYIGDDNEVHVPYKFGLYEVKSIKSGAFKDTSAEIVYLYDNLAYIDSDAFDEGVTLKYIDIYGNEVNDPTYKKGSDFSISTGDNNDNPEDTTVQTNEDSEFEEDTIDISEELASNNGEETVKEETDRKRRKSKERILDRITHLFDGSLFSSDFEKNIAGYIIIGVSVVLLIGIVIYIFKKNKVEK